ncbi:hypothetical protein ESCO_006639 [Escovopsis weberi]|uniref:Uncharacterized protein n=1 Tax=Escovopsis weberi TaxID=150374 RepID=A0A0M9VXK8_ESCWE|nr:hypothetical protein ESCO_006639 [Escovopsis weberi]
MLPQLLSLGLGAALATAFSIGTEMGGCELLLTAGGAISGPVGELPSGQVRAGEGVAPSNFTIKGDKLWDRKGHGCWWTPPALVLQCDVDQVPQDGFEIGCDGLLSYHGQKEFYECETGEKGQYNVYLEDRHEAHCGRVTLTAGGCRPDRCVPTPPADALPLPSPSLSPSLRLPLPLPTSTASSCPVDLDGPFEFPHLIVSVDKARPERARGTSFFGVVSPTTSSLFNFDIPPGDEHRTCTLVFLLPRREDLETASYELEGAGRLRFSWLKRPTEEGTTWATRPGKRRDLGTITVSPGHGYEVATFPCPAGERIAFGMEGDVDGDGDGDEATGTRLEFFEDWNPAPLGLYIRKC